MAEQCFLKNAPIREAIIDLKVAPQVGLAGIESLAKSLLPQFPTQGLMKLGAFGFEIGLGKLSSSFSDGGVVGYRLTSADGKYIIQLRTDGFTFSCLPPYEGWDAMTEHAKPLWRDYVASSGAVNVTRTAVRNINVVDLPLPAELSDYLIASPEIPEGLPQELSSFFSRVVIENRDIKATGVVTLALESSSEQQSQLILDIDVFKVMQEELTAGDSLIWDTLTQLREFKNKIFFLSITEKTKEMYL